MKGVIQFIKGICRLFCKHLRLEENQSFIEEEIQTLEQVETESIIEEEERAPILDSVAVEIFSQIDRGDIIYAKRVDKENPNRIIEAGHEVGPFLVIENLGDKLLCFSGTSNLRKRSNQFVVDCENYIGLTKKTVFGITNIFEITLDLYIRKLDTLNDLDKHIFQKTINLSSRRHPSLTKYVQYCRLDPGDIFKSLEELYFVYKIENNVLIAIGISTTNISNYRVESNHRTYYIDFENVKKFVAYKNFSVFDFVTEFQYKKISMQFKNYLAEQERKKVVSRGSVLKYKGMYVYIYSLEGNVYLGYPICEHVLDEEFPIIIDHKMYSADFDQIYRIEKNDEFELFATASIDEADNNKMVKKSYHKSNAKLELKQRLEMQKSNCMPKKDIQTGSIVCDKTLLHMRYLVLERMNDDLFTIMLDEDCISFSYLDISEVDFEKTLNQEEFKHMLIILKEQLPNFDKVVDENILQLTLDKDCIL